MKNLTCNICKTAVSDKKELKSHFKTGKVKIYSCKKCRNSDSVIPSKITLLRHASKMAKKEKVLENKEESTSRSLHLEILNKNGENLEYPSKPILDKLAKENHVKVSCGKCSARYWHKLDLEIHTENCSKDKDLKICLKCGKSFTRIGDMIR